MSEESRVTLITTPGIEDILTFCDRCAGVNSARTGVEGGPDESQEHTLDHRGNHIDCDLQGGRGEMTTSLR